MNPPMIEALAHVSPARRCARALAFLMLVIAALAVAGVIEASAQRRRASAPARKPAASALAAKPDAVTQNGHSHPIERLVVSPDGKTVATGADGGGFGFEIKLWNI